MKLPFLFRLGVLSMLTLTATLSGEPNSEKWSFATGDEILSSPAIGDNGQVYISSRDNHVYALDSATGEKIWDFETGAWVFSSPGVGAAGTVYVGSADGHVYAFDGKTGEELWSYETGDWVESSPALGRDGTDYFGSRDHHLYALTGSGSLADTPWPKFRRTPGNTGSVQELANFRLTAASAPEFIDLRDPLEIRFVIENTGARSGTIPFVDLLISGTGREIDATLTDITIAPGDAFEGQLIFDTVDQIFTVGDILAWTIVIRDSEEFLFGGTEVANTTGPGSVQWFFETNSGVKASPAIGPDGTIYIGSRDGQVYALDAVGGEERWAFPTGWLVNSTPAIRMDGTVYVGSSDRNVYAIDGDSGQELWAFETGGQVESSPAIGLTGTVYVGSADGYVYAIDGTSGEELWTFATGGNVRSSPAIGRDGILYVGSADRNVYALHTITGQEIWTFNTRGLVYSSPAIGSDGTVYIGSGDRHLYALDERTGEELWSVETGGAVYSSPVLGIGERLFVGSNDHNIYAIDTSNGEVLWTYKTDAVINEASAAIGADNTVYIGSHDRHLYALDGDTGERLWTYETASWIESSPAIASDGTVYFSSWDGRVYALNAEDAPLVGPWPKFRYSPRNTGSIQSSFPPEPSTPEERIGSFLDLEEPGEIYAGKKVESRWLGTLALNNTFDIDAVQGWLFHDQHGWLYWFGNGWFWRHSQQRWTYTTGETYPFVYVHQVGWFYFYRESPDFPQRQWFSSYREEGGEQVPDAWVRWFHHLPDNMMAFRLENNDFQPGLELLLVVEEGDEEIEYTLVFGEDNQVRLPAFDEEGTYAYEVIDAQGASLTLSLAPAGEPDLILKEKLFLTFESANEGHYKLISHDEEKDEGEENHKDEGRFVFR